MAFVHQPLTDATRNIRLFKINQHDQTSQARLSLTLTEHRISDVAFDSFQGISYTALSYMWGPNEPLNEIRINQKLFTIRDNLFEFLIHLTEREKENTFWADAVCINQRDLKERNAQVTIMGAVFESAANVLAWVGPPHFDVDIFFFLAHAGTSDLMLPAYTDAGFKIEHNDISEESDGAWVDSETLVLAMRRFASRKYWKRLWIIQELGLGRKTIVASGPHRADLLDLRDLYLTLLVKAPEAFQDMRGSYLAHMRLDARGTLKTLIERHGKADCKDPRDRIFGIRGLQRDSAAKNSLKPDYDKSRLDLYWEVLGICKHDGPKLNATFARKLLQVLEIPLEALLQHFEARLASKSASSFQTLDLGRVSPCREVIRDCYPQCLRWPDQQTTTPGRSPSSTGFDSSGGRNWLTYAAVQRGDHMLTFTSKLGEDLLAAVVAVEDDGTGSTTAAWAVDWAANYRTASRPLYWLEDHCPEFKLIQAPDDGYQPNKRDSGYAEYLQRGSWVLTPPIVIAILLLEDDNELPRFTS